ncbi:MAG: sodium:solute symporter family protein [Acidobacteria bacterium]|nr:sodium:solute symporter family protein [Acidobacteriota bacterium]
MYPTAQLALLLLYSIGLTLFGVWVGRKVRGSADFFVAGRKLTAPLIFSTVLAANVGAGTTIGAAGQAYIDGVSAWFWNGAAGLGSIVLAFWIGPRLWQAASDHGFLTAGDYLEYRYGPLVRGLLASLIWLGTLAILAGQLIAGAAVLTAVADIPRPVGAAIGGIAMTIYFTAGGLLSSAWVNAVQLSVLLVGLIIAVPLGLSAAGGLSAIAASPDLPATFWDPWYSSGPGSGYAFLALLGPAFVISPGLIQKAYGAESQRAVKLGIGAAGIAQMLFAFVPLLLGLAARHLHPGLAERDLVLPTLLVQSLPWFIGTVALAAVFSAEVSTCDAILFMLSTSLSQDLYKRFLNPQATDRQVLFVARAAALVGGLAGVLLAVQLPNVIAALSIFYSLLGVSLFVPIVAGLYVARAGTPEALAAVAAGMITLLYLRVQPWAATSIWFNPSLAGLVAAAMAFFLVAAVRRPAPTTR